MASLPRSVRTTVVTTLCCALFVLLSTPFAPAALAHDRLKSSSPAKGAKVSAVERIKLEFSSRMRFPTVALRTAGDVVIDIGKAKGAGDTVTSDVPEPLPAGKYVIAWRVVSSDGHPIEGEIPFTVTAPATPSAIPSRTPTSESDTSAVPSADAQPSSPAPTSPTSAVADAPVSATDDRQASEGLPGWTWIALVALALIGAGTWSLTSRRGRPGGGAE
ncbi:copper resistance protein CopC [Streptosporangium sp. NPDC000509]|uniref:copper resistance CopC family protein n=1 Tax=Streptosporangium sp. NPDC000509 TaxID=3366186 RepID=UPI00369EC089